MSILDDSVVEDTEFINLALTSVDNAVILNPATARINIEDVDSELTIETAIVNFMHPTLSYGMGCQGFWNLSRLTFVLGHFSIIIV